MSKRMLAGHPPWRQLLNRLDFARRLAHDVLAMAGLRTAAPAGSARPPTSSTETPTLDVVDAVVGVWPLSRHTPTLVLSCSRIAPRELLVTRS